jgi:hypothetical protein
MPAGCITVFIGARHAARNPAGLAAAFSNPRMILK